uniref:Alpha-macroglobulin receptor-binding domain-containing protein n=1 Tax=Ascaris lumbricoides TaxID=6252 RepID=A0A9J2Q7I6_ASCLU
MSEMLTFSDCHGNGSCGFALYRNPQQISDRSVFLSTLSISLLCEANADERIVCPTLKYLLSVIETSTGNIDDRLLNQIDFKTNDDRIWFLTAMFNQLASDCGIYQCLRNDRAWIRLRRSFLNLSSNTPTDVRTVAALAFMAPKTTADIMRIKMYTSIQDGMLPYWTAGSATGVSLLAKLRSRYNDLLGRRSAKSGDVLVNSLGVLAFISRGIEPAYRIVEFDSLVDWIVEQLGSEQDAPTAVETYFANRAIYEYRSRKHNPIANEPQMVTVLCSACKTNSYNVSDTAVLFYLPHSVRSLTFTTEGRSKIRVGVRILAKKRQRLRRELDQDDYYPVRINVIQQKADAGALRQQVCLRLETAMIDSLEITHGLFTGFTTTSNHFRLLPNTTFEGVRLVSRVVVSSYAAHFILSNLKPKLDLCYELGSTEPRNRYQPDRLAPVAITARHASYDYAILLTDVIGQSLITHVDRSKRANIDESIDTICWQGTCSCAETTCTVRCAQCRGIDKSRLRAELCAPQSFGAAVEVKSVREESMHGARYIVVDVSLEHWKHLRNNTLAKTSKT